MAFDYSIAPLAQLQSFLSEHRDALLCASELLGGPTSARRCARILMEGSTATAVTARIRRELSWLHGLLALNHVHDLDSQEAACFAEIDPADPRVEEICALADALLHELDDLPPTLFVMTDAASAHARSL